MDEQRARRGGALPNLAAATLWLAASALILGGIARPGFAASGDPPRVTARAALVLDAQTGEVLWQRNGDLPLPPASTTKVLTTLIALESGRLDEQFTVSSYAQSQSPSKIDLRAGQHIRLMDLTYALMLKSANDAAVVVAEGLSGNVEAFAVRMNKRAREIGATNSNFHNPNGLPDDEHVSTAHDLAMILRHALTVPGFRGVASTQQTEIPVVGNSVRMVSVKTHNRLLGGYVVPVVGKTGYTRAAGRCFVGAAELGGHEVVVAVLGSTNLWVDARRLIEYGLTSVAPEESSGLQFAAYDGPSVKHGGSSAHSHRSAAVAKSGHKSHRTAQAGKKTSHSGSARAAGSSGAQKSVASRQGCHGSHCRAEAAGDSDDGPEPARTSSSKKKSAHAGNAAHHSSSSAGSR